MIRLYKLSDGRYGVRSVALAEALGVSKPSVHNMLRSLAELGMIRQESFGRAFFTEKGRILAEKYSFCYTYLEKQLAAVCGEGAVSENAVCGLLADMPLERIEEVYNKKAE